MESVPIGRIADLKGLEPKQLVSYITACSVDYQPASLRNVASSVRDFLPFAQQQGWTDQSLDLAVPKIACGAWNDLPVYLSPQQLGSLLGS